VALSSQIVAGYAVEQREGGILLNMENILYIYYIYIYIIYISLSLSLYIYIYIYIYI